MEELNKKQKQGFIKLYRKIQDSSLWNTRVDFFGAAIKLILLVNYKSKKWYSKKLKKEVPVKRGEIITTRRNLPKLLGLSEQSTRTFLKFLKNINFLSLETTQDFTKICICNYEEYQNKPTQWSTYDQPKSNPSLTKTKDKKIRRIEEASSNKLTKRPLDIPNPIWQKARSKAKDLSKEKKVRIINRALVEKIARQDFIPDPELLNILKKYNACGNDDRGTRLREVYLKKLSKFPVNKQDEAKEFLKQTNKKVTKE